MNVRKQAVAGLVSLCLAGGSAALASDSQVKPQKTQKAVQQAGSESHAADNSGVNERDRAEGEVTADQQKNNRTDLELTRDIRRSVIDDKSLSVNGHNVKIIAQNGTVTLKGPVNSKAEKMTIERKAEAVAGKANVTSEIEVKP